MSVANETLWYVESHLTSDLSLDAVAGVVGVSRYHLSRAFTAAVGHSVSEYARSRRLTEAAKALAHGAPDILALAFEAGYGSHEAFTRAFRQHFSMTPEQVRARGHTHDLVLTEAIRMNTKATEHLAAPRLAKRDAFLVFGLSQTYVMGPDQQQVADIPSQWQRFLTHLGRVEEQVGTDTYGVCFNPDDAGHFEYIAGMEVREFPAAPAELRRLRIPPQSYAVFHHAGHVSTISESWDAIWQYALRDAGQQAADGPMFERYGSQFDSSTGTGGVELWVPIRG